MQSSIYLINWKQLKVLFIVFLLKIVYELSIQLMLPETYLLWSFNKNVDWSYLVIELPFFFIASILYCMSFDDNSPLTFFLTIIFVLYFIPTNSSLVLSNVSMKYYLFTNIFALIFIVIMGIVIQKDTRQIWANNIYAQDKQSSIDNFIENPTIWWIVRSICILVCLATLLYVYNYNGLNLSLAFNEMYSVRAGYAKHAADITGSFSSYITLIVTRLGGWVLPLYLYYALKKKRLPDILFALFTFVANFSVEMQKNSLMIVIIIIGIAFVEKNKSIENISALVLELFGIMLLVSLGEYCIHRESFIFTVFIRRMLYIPAYMNEKYYEFFSVNKKIFFTQDAFFIQNILQRLFGRAYEKSAVSIISNACFNGELPSPNTGLFAEAYAQLGGLGLIVFPFIYRYIVMLMYKIMKFYGKGALYVIFFKLALSMVSVFTLTSSTFVGIVLFIGITILLKEISKSICWRMYG